MQPHAHHERKVKSAPAKASKTVVIRSYEHKKRVVPDNPMTYEELTPEGTRSMMMFVATGAANQNTGIKPLQHRGDETMYVISGRFEVETDDLKFSLGPGDSAFFPRGDKHRVTILGDEPGKAVFTLSPPEY